jgi:hypothetical protein
MQVMQVMQVMKVIKVIKVAIAQSKPIIKKHLFTVT